MDEIRTCAACRYSRMKCSSDCPLAAYFSVAGNQDFRDVFRIYRASRIKEALHLLKNKHQRDAAVKTIIFRARQRRQENDAAAQAQLQDIKRSHITGPGPIPVPGSGRKRQKTEPVLALGGPLRDATRSGQETETGSGVGSSTTTTEFGSGSGRQIDPRVVTAAFDKWIKGATGSGQEIETRSGLGSRVTTELWTPEDGDMTWVEDTIKYFFDGDE